jgi:tripartite-type tricarboxylate transporter receptor subunit TctC
MVHDNGRRSRKLATRTIGIVSAITVLIATIDGPAAEDYPSRPITMVVPFAAGGPTDTLARIIAERMRPVLGHPIVIENVTGAGGTIGVGRVARAAPDGYTLGIGAWNTHVVNGAIYSLRYDVFADFDPVALIANNTQLILSNKQVPAHDLKELISWVKANQGQISAGNGGLGTSSHVGAVFFQRLTGTQFPLVPYRSGMAAVIQDLIGGRIDLMFDQVSSALAHVRAGSIKAYAVAAPERLAIAPEIPTTDEAGLPGFHISVWHALWVPKGTPASAIAKLNTAVVEALSDPAIANRLGELGQDIPPRDRQTPQALGNFHKSEIDKWSPILKAANIKID